MPAPRSTVHPCARSGSGRGRAERSIHERLRRETAAAHDVLDRRLDLTGRAALSAGRYREVLQAFYGFYEPLEARLRCTALAVGTSGLELRDRARLLAADLSALGMSWAEVAGLPRCGELPAACCRAQLAGCVYVLEGASLGGRIVARAVERRGDPQLGRATAFFAGDGAQTGLRWKAVLAWLEESVHGGASSDDLVEAANATFECLTRWLQGRGVAS